MFNLQQLTPKTKVFLFLGREREINGNDDVLLKIRELVKESRISNITIWYNGTEIQNLTELPTFFDELEGDLEIREYSELGK